MPAGCPRLTDLSTQSDAGIHKGIHSGSSTNAFVRVLEEKVEMDDPNKVWPTGLTIRESEEVHRQIIDGTRVFGAISLFAHLLVYVYSPWLH